MNFPVFLNKWIIGFKPIKHTIFWYWYRLINHDNWRMDDHHRYWDFWLNLNKGYHYMQYEYEYFKVCGKVPHYQKARGIDTSKRRRIS